MLFIVYDDIKMFSLYILGVIRYQTRLAYAINRFYTNQLINQNRCMPLSERNAQGELTSLWVGLVDI